MKRIALAAWVVLQGMVVSTCYSQDKGLNVVSNKREGVHEETGSWLYSGLYALLIGNVRYAEWPDLERIPDELESIKTVLEDVGYEIYGDKVHLDLNDIEFRDLVEAFIDDHGVSTKADQGLLIFYSGHGYSEGNTGYLVPVDAPNPKRDLNGFRQRAIELTRVRSWAERIKVNHSLFCFDSCFSGMVFSARSTGVPKDIAFKASKPVRQFLTAGSKDEEVPGASAFAPYFVRGISGEADSGVMDGYVTATELAEYLTSKVAQAVGNHVQFGELPHPYDQGDMVFRVNPSPGNKPLVDVGQSLSSKKQPRSFVNSLGMTFVPLEGSDLWISVHETRVSDYRVFASGDGQVNPEWENVQFDGIVQGPNHPVVNINWKDAQRFCEWLTEREGGHYRLPTAREWGVAAGMAILEEKAGEQFEDRSKDRAFYPWGPAWPPPHGIGNFSGRESAWQVARMADYEDPFPFTAPVGSFASNAAGLKDVGGNVKEWCADYLGDDPAVRVIQGGSWCDVSEGLDLSRHFQRPMQQRDLDVGFRCVVEKRSTTK